MGTKQKNEIVNAEIVNALLDERSVRQREALRRLAELIPQCRTSIIEFLGEPADDGETNDGLTCAARMFVEDLGMSLSRAEIAVRILSKN